MLAANGRYATITVSADRPRFRAENRLEGQPAENHAVVRGTNASFGTWSVDADAGLLTLWFEGNLFPNLEGTKSKRSITLAGDELTVCNPAPGIGGTAHIVYRRAG